MKWGNVVSGLGRFASAAGMSVHFVSPEARYEKRISRVWLLSAWHSSAFTVIRFPEMR